MSKQNGNKGRRFDRVFKEEAVRLLQTSGRRQREIADDLLQPIACQAGLQAFLHALVTRCHFRRVDPLQAIFDLLEPERIAVNDAGHPMAALADREVGSQCRGGGRAYKPTEHDNCEQH